MSKPFLSAAWKKLVLANYAIDPGVLKPFVPACTELDHFNDQYYVSLVGFMFRETKVMGMKIPFHVNFPEVNLRFYVRYRDEGIWKRGVVFISEIVPKYAVAFIANKLYKENYRRMPMRVTEIIDADTISLSYQWQFGGRWNQIEAQAPNQLFPLQEGSEAEFITEHFWGYSKAGDSQCTEYQVAHPRWDLYSVSQYNISCDFASLYGPCFGFLDGLQPGSVFFAEGSNIQVYPKKLIRF